LKAGEMSANLEYLSELLQAAEEKLSSKKIAAGLDGFIDSIVKVINYKDAGNEPVFFNTIEEFGSYISGKKGSGFSLESEELFQKIGGNMPIMSNAMACMGTQVNCIGAFGVPAIVPVFREMHSNCKLFSFTNPGFTTAIEFTDGKMMLAQMTDLNHANWNTINQALGLETIITVFKESDLFCLVNWSELDNSNEIWKGILEDVVAAQIDTETNKQFFFDLSDCSKRSPAAIKTALDLINQFNNYGSVTLSLNRNEAGIVFQNCFGEIAGQDLEATGGRLFDYLNVNTLIIHSARTSIAWDQHGSYVSAPVFIAEPTISTGAGDNFNAGFCIARLLGGSVAASVELANIVSHLYMRTGKSPDLQMLHAYISELASASY
jgi:hypothetical protein